MITKDWPPQFVWAMRGSGGGGGSGDIRNIHVHETDGTNIPVTTAATSWAMANSTGYPMFIQTYDDTGDEMRGDVSGSD